ncbi:triose-phosphate isomerase [Enterobacteriaceae endosymbiont of Donacia tomentosa]|uniref:triose-phosphate isomerase n=1 Tax=Enterobacteriaceae endosymbiont of Donacia tomentosa TaxID=2675787 RepID=UPI001449C9E2|nr:triose-phosphate isomerase [Enterobacteriaceae endosymbiont of Donacia tomentosa]QJC31635.1 triose-phosphate isomerase [Enterobacteriaceae endosymbiont of Donacia tomentosa]
MKKCFIISNWKLNGDLVFLKKNINIIKKEFNFSLKFCDLAIAPPYVYLHTMYNYIKNTSIHLAAQNVDIHTQGAFTGEISVSMLKDVGVKYVIIGHSERKLFHNENYDNISTKFVLIKNFNLIPILCIGETEEEKKQNKTEKICVNQINYILKTQGVEILNNAIIAYEPIWAIGSGKVADANEVQKVHSFIRKYIASINQKVATNIILQYGGSVNNNNINNFLDKKDINGFLIGKASLTTENFISLVKKAEKKMSLLNRF